MFFRQVLRIILFIPFWAAYAGGGSVPPKEYNQIQENHILAQVTQQPGEAAIQEQSRGETVFRAISRAYPDRTKEPEFRDGDWTIEVYGEVFYFAEGKLLPASLRSRMNEYAPLPFYNYQKELPPWTAPTAEETERMRQQERERETRQTLRSTEFFDALWRTRNRDDAWEHVKQIRFLGNQIQVHYSILVKLSLVEETILRIAKTNTAVRQWADNITSADSWNWRNIASNQNRSFHAYGAAVDLLPRSLGGLETYWFWTARHTPDWWTVPYSKRYHPPDEVIKAFESFGFIWGGKWRFYDTMHFEYRPEILILSGIPITDLRDLRQP